MANETAEVGDVNTITGVVDAVAFRGRFCQVWLMAGGERLLFGCRVCSATRWR